MHNERKLENKGLLRLFTKGVLTVRDFIASFSDNKTDIYRTLHLLNTFLIEIWIQKLKAVSELFNVNPNKYVLGNPFIYLWMNNEINSLI